MSQAAQNTRPHTAPRSARFGPFELSLETGELRKHGVRVRLQHRPFQILAALIESPGRLVTRDELRTRLWSTDVFVDFESGLNTAVNRLRFALGDSAENPLYVETLSRLGYRFLAPVEISYEEPEQIYAPPIPAIPPSPEPLQPKSDIAPSYSAARSARLWLSALAMALVLVAVTAAIVLKSNRHESSFNRLTFRKGFVSQARFVPNTGLIVYSAEWNGSPSHLFSLSADRRESKDLNLSDAWLAGIASPTEVGLFLRPGNGDPPLLETASLSGGAPHPIASHVKNADWGPKGSLCLLTAFGSTYIVEYPQGHKLYQSLQWISDLRVSPDGRQVAFTEHPVPMDDAGHVTIVDSATGQSRILSEGWGSLEGLAWNPSGREVWFTASRSGVEKSLWAVNLDGQTRLLSQSPGGLELLDISPSGQLLVTRTSQHMTMFLGDLSHSSEQDISWLDWSRAAAISADGSATLFDESGSGGGAAYSLFVYRRGSSSPERIGSGRAMDLSSDGRWALAQDAADPTKLTVVSVDTHAANAIPAHSFVYRWSKFFPDAQQILSSGHFPGQREGIYRQHLNEAPQLVNSRLQLADAVIDPTGHFAAGVSDKCEITILDLANGQTRTITISKMAYPVVFLNAGQVVTRTTANKVITLDLLDTKTGRLSLFRRIEPTDPTGIALTFPMQMARNLQTYVYSRLYSYSDLFLVSGLR
jgi:DNA-binding winged helix-turn-helix (wHTH) protein